MMANKGSYAPPMDAVQEFTVQQNSVDAELGNSTGGTVLRLPVEKELTRTPSVHHFRFRNSDWHQLPC